MSNLSDLCDQLFNLDKDGKIAKVITNAGNILGALSDAGGVIGLGFQIKDLIAPDPSTGEILAKLEDLYAEIAAVAQAENATQQEAAALDKHMRMLAIDEEMAKAAAVQDQLPALLSNATPPSAAIAADMINKCLEVVNYFLPPQDGAWFAVYTGHPYYSDGWSGVLAPQSPQGGLVFDPTYTLPSFLRSITTLVVTISALDPGNLKNYTTVLSQCAKRLEYVHDTIVEQGIVTTKIPSGTEVGKWNTDGTFTVKWSSTDPPMMYPYGAVDAFSGANNVGSYMDEIGYQLLIDENSKVTIAGFQSLLKLRLILKSKALYRQLGLLSVVTASEALRRMTSQPQRNIVPYQDYPYEAALGVLGIAIPNPYPIPDALRGFLSNVPPYTYGVSRWVGPPFEVTPPLVRTYTFTPRIVRELIETDLRDSASQLLTEASFSHQTDAWRPVFEPGSVSLNWVPGAAKDGQQLLRVSSPDGSVGQDITKAVMPGESFSFQVWLRTSPGAPSPQDVTLALWGLGDTLEHGTTDARITGDWSLVTVGLDAQTAHDTLRAELYVSNSVDMSGAVVFPAGLTEASFSHQTDAWTMQFQARPNSVIWRWVPGAAKDGQQLLRVSSPDGSVGQDITKAVMPGESYSFRVWLRTSPGAPSPQDVKLALSGLGDKLEQGTTDASVIADWSLVTVGLDAQTAHDTLQAELYVSNSIDMSGARLIGIP